MRLRIVNWQEYQHYRDRCPPWVRLHWAMLTSRTWVTCTDASRVLAVASILLASRDKSKHGEFDGDPEYVRRVCYLNQPPDWTELLAVGFVEVVKDGTEVQTHGASALLANCTTEQSRADTDTPNPPQGDVVQPDMTGWEGLVSPANIVRYFRLLTTADPSPAMLAYWKAAMAELATLHADPEAVGLALDKFAKADPRFRGTMPEARRLKADWFLGLVTKYGGQAQ